MAHVLEHMLFKGSKKYGVGEISSTVEFCGGDMNAYTSFDRTVYFLTISSQYAEKSVDLLSDAVFHSSFDADELSKEKEVIIEEINRSLDNPANSIGRYVFETIYDGTNAADPIIGSKESVLSFNRSDLVNFHKRWYQPSNMKVVVVGDFDPSDMISYVEKYFGAVEDCFEGQIADLKVNKIKEPKIKILREDISQPRLEIAYQVPSLHHFQTVYLDLAAFALGSGEASRYNQILRDEKAIVSAAGASLYSPNFGGIYSLSAAPIIGKEVESIKEISAELASLMHKDIISDEELVRAYSNAMSDKIFQEETISGQARSLGFSLFTSEHLHYDDIYEFRLKNAKPSDVTKSLVDNIDLLNPVITLLMPEDSNLSEEEVLKAYKEGIDQSRASDIIDYVSEDYDIKDPETIDICNGIKLVYRQDPDCRLFNLSIAAEGGQRAETKDTVGLFNIYANLICTQTKSRSYEELLYLSEGEGIVLAGFSGKDSFGIKLQCLSEQAEEMTALWADCFLNPIFPRRQYDAVMLELEADFNSAKDAPAQLAILELQRLVFEDHPYRYPIYGDDNITKSISFDNLEKDYYSYRDGSSWVIGGSGSLPVDLVAKQLKEAFSSWTQDRSKAWPLQNVVNDSSRSEKSIIKKDKEQCHIILGQLGVSWGHEDRSTLDVVMNALGGSGGRLFMNLREKESLAYTVTPILSYSQAGGIIGAYMATSTDKLSRAMDLLRAEFTGLKDTPLSSNEIERAKNFLVGQHEASMQRSDSQAMSMALMEAYGIGHADFMTYSDKIRAVTEEDCVRIVMKYFDISEWNEVVVGKV